MNMPYSVCVQDQCGRSFVESLLYFPPARKGEQPTTPPECIAQLCLGREGEAVTKTLVTAFIHSDPLKA